MGPRVEGRGWAVSVQGGLRIDQGRSGSCPGEPNRGMERTDRRVATGPVVDNVTAAPCETQRRLS
jgi:hypothetical protein